MAKFRYAVLANDKAETDSSTSGTVTIDLPERGILTEVNLMVRCAQTYTDNQTLPFHHAIKKIELLVDGSTVVKSLTGLQARALMAYRGGPFGITNDYLQGVNHNLYYHSFILYLGRFAGDTKYGLRLDAFSNPQLKFTYDLSTVTYDGVTYDSNTTDPTLTYNVMAKLLDGAPTGFTDKFIQSRQIDSWTVAASEEHNTEIPRGYPLFGLMLRAGYLDKYTFDFLNHVKLDFDNGKWLPIDMDYENLFALLRDIYPKPMSHSGYLRLANGDNFDAQFLHVVGGGINVVAGNAATIKIPYLGLPISVVSCQDYTGAALTSQVQCNYNILGYGPHQTVYIPMSHLLDGEAISIPTTDYGRIDLKIETSSDSGSDAETSVVAEYVKPNRGA